eukprot:1161320-Pelagomonas_calceolata.AAC.1
MAPPCKRLLAAIDLADACMNKTPTNFQNFCKTCQQPISQIRALGQRKGYIFFLKGYKGYNPVLQGLQPFLKSKQ